MSPTSYVGGFVKIIILFLLYCPYLHAESTWFYGTRKLDVVYLQEEKVFISNECLKVKESCLAFKAISHPLPGIFSTFGGVNLVQKFAVKSLLGKFS